MSIQYAYFKELPPCTVFNVHGGTVYKKQSTRTARMISPFKGDWFYFGKRELCIVANYSRLDKCYFEGQKNV